jgi:hypothetical protein
VRLVALVPVLPVVVFACSKGPQDAPRREPGPASQRPAPAPPEAAEASPPTATSYPDLGAALAAIVPAETRVVGFGELHSRTDRAQVRSALARFTEALPAIAERISDLVVETWIVDPKCGQAAQTATAKVEITMRRPQETKSEIALLAEAARAAKIQPHAMRIRCEDYAVIAPPDKDVDPEQLLDLTTRELARITGEAIAHRDAAKEARPWIAVYGGALHNDRFPQAGVEDWSYAAAVDAATRNRYVEVDLVVPELAAADPVSQAQPWFPLVESAGDQIQVWQRGERSYVVVLTSTPASSP